MHNVSVSANSTISVLTSMSMGLAKICNKVSLSQSKCKNLRNFKEILCLFESVYLKVNFFIGNFIIPNKKVTLKKKLCNIPDEVLNKIKKEREIV